MVLQADSDALTKQYNEEKVHSGTGSAMSLSHFFR